MCVPSQNPPSVSAPARFINRVRIVAQHQRCSALVETRQRWRWFEAMGPQVIQTGNLKSIDVGNFVTQHP
jgi:hypothetical protein